MMKRTAVVAGLLAALLAVAVLAVGGASAATQTNDTGDRNASLGADISSFMQASSAEAEGEVDDGMFDAALNRTDDPEKRRALVESRQKRLQQRQERLAQRRAEISDGDAPGVKAIALATHVEVGADSLERSANETDAVAREVGVNTTVLDEIRRNASQLRGPEVAALARNVAGNPPAGNAQPGEGGPPGDGPMTNRSGSDNPVTNETGSGGPPDDAPGNDSANDSGNDSVPGGGAEAGEDDTGPSNDGGESGDEPGGGNGGGGDGADGGQQSNAAGEAPGSRGG